MPEQFSKVFKTLNETYSAEVSGICPGIGRLEEEEEIQYFRNKMSQVQLFNTESCKTFPWKLSVCVTCTMTLHGFALKGIQLKN